jgi:hypothetical protein
MNYTPFTVAHVVDYIQLLLATAVAFWLLLPRLQPQAYLSLDFDWFYRRPLAYVFQVFICSFKRVKVWLDASGIHLLNNSIPYFANPFMAPLKMLWSVSPSIAAGQRGEGAGGLVPYDENSYRFSLGVTMLLAVLFVGIIAVYTLSLL